MLAIAIILFLAAVGVGSWCLMAMQIERISITSVPELWRSKWVQSLALVLAPSFAFGAAVSLGVTAGAVWWGIVVAGVTLPAVWYASAFVCGAIWGQAIQQLRLRREKEVLEMSVEVDAKLDALKQAREIKGGPLSLSEILSAGENTKPRGTVGFDDHRDDKK